MLPILLPQLLAVATFRGIDVTSHTPDAELEDESSDRIESGFRNEQLSPYVKYDDDLKGKRRAKRSCTRAADKIAFCSRPLPLLFVPF